MTINSIHAFVSIYIHVYNMCLHACVIEVLYMLCVHVKLLTPAWRIGDLLTPLVQTHYTLCMPIRSSCTILELFDCIHINATCMGQILK